MFTLGTASAAELSFSDVRYSHQTTGNVQVRALREASGLAVSRRHPRVLWSHNDSGYGPQLFALDETGELRGRYFVKKASSRDWEDIASFNWQQKSWLAIADTGNNSAKNLPTLVHLVIEPEVPEKKRQSKKLDVLHPEYSLRFTFPHGPADCESIAVDEVEKKIYLLTKRQVPPRLYSLPLPDEDHDSSTLLEATFEGQIASIPKPSLQELIDYPTFGLHRSQPTAMDFAKDRSFVIVSTYGYAYLFPRSGTQSWIEALNSKAQRITVPFRKQGESVAVGEDSQSLYFTSEGKQPPIYKMWPKPPSNDVPVSGAEEPMIKSEPLSLSTKDPS